MNTINIFEDLYLHTESRKRMLHSYLAIQKGVSYVDRGGELSDDTLFGVGIDKNKLKNEMIKKHKFLT